MFWIFPINNGVGKKRVIFSWLTSKVFWGRKVPLLGIIFCQVIQVGKWNPTLYKQEVVWENCSGLKEDVFSNSHFRFGQGEHMEVRARSPRMMEKGATPRGQNQGVIKNSSLHPIPPQTSQCLPSWNSELPWTSDSLFPILQHSEWEYLLNLPLSHCGMMDASGKQIICHCCSGSRGDKTEGKTIAANRGLIWLQRLDITLCFLPWGGSSVIFCLFSGIFVYWLVFTEEELVEYLMTRKTDCGRLQGSLTLGSLFFLNA